MRVKENVRGARRDTEHTCKVLDRSDRNNNRKRVQGGRTVILTQKVGLLGKVGGSWPKSGT